VRISTALRGALSIEKRPVPVAAATAGRRGRTGGHPRARGVAPSRAHR
jgi:hypothetical protein